MKFDFLYNFALCAGKKYVRGVSVVFAGINIFDSYQKYENDYWMHNLIGKLFISCAWPVTLPLISIMGSTTSEKERPYVYGTMCLLAALLILP